MLAGMGAPVTRRTLECRRRRRTVSPWLTVRAGLTEAFRYPGFPGMNLLVVTEPVVWQRAPIAQENAVDHTGVTVTVAGQGLQMLLAELNRLNVKGLAQSQLAGPW